MGVIKTPFGYEDEHLVDIPVGNARCRIISGYANLFAVFHHEHHGPLGGAGTPLGSDQSDTKWVEHEVHLVVGPRWLAVREVSPIVNVAGHSFDDSDEVDDSGFHIDTCEWDTVGLAPPDDDYERIRLKLKLRWRGGLGSECTKLSYQLAALGVV